MKNFVLLSLILLACSSGFEKPKNSVPVIDVQEIHQCLDEHNQVAVCNADYDCCPNFSCSYDPEKSNIIRYCVYDKK